MYSTLGNLFSGLGVASAIAAIGFVNGKIEESVNFVNVIQGFGLFFLFITLAVVLVSLANAADDEAEKRKELERRCAEKLRRNAR